MNIDSLTLEVADLAAAERFYTDAFDLGTRLRLATSDAPSAGFRGFHVSLLVAQPAEARALFDAATGAGATAVKPVTKSLWGVGGVLRAPDGTIWKIATSAKKDTAPAGKRVEHVVLLVGVDDIGASKRFYVDRRLRVAKSFGKYVEFDLGASPIGFGLYTRKALAKDAGVAPDGTGSHRLVINADTPAFTDPDGFRWQTAAVRA